MKNRNIFAAMLLVLACVWLSLGAQAGTNTAYGDGALGVTSGTNNSGFGWAALYSDTSGSRNTAVGFAALVSNKIGSGNTAVGASALLVSTGGSNTAVGESALTSATTGGAFGIQSNTAVGDSALYHCTTGYYNVAIGYLAGYDLTEGYQNVIIGQAAGNDLVTGHGNVYIGYGVDGFAGSTNTTRIRNIGSTPITGGIPVVIDSTSQEGDSLLGYASSSRRYKEDIKPMEKASEALFALKPVTFQAKGDSTRVRLYGLIAEDVANVSRDLAVYNLEGQPETVRYDAVNAMLLNEFLKEHRTVQELKKEIAALTSTVKEQAAQIQKVSAHIEMGKPAPKVVSNP